MPMLPACTICQNADAVQILDRPLAIYACRRCRHFFTGASEIIAESYDDAYYLEKHKNWFAHPNWALFRYAHQTIRQGFPGGKVRLLDIGCGKGAFLQFLQKEDPALELHGLDTVANHAPGIHFMQGDFHQVKISEPFDVVTSFMAIEHMDRPVLFLKKIRACLLPGGLLILSTNNASGLMYALGRILRRLGMRTAFDRLYSHHHLQHFSNDSLRRLLKQKGFEILSFKNHNYSLKAVDTPDGPAWIKKFYLAAVAVIFFLSDLFGNQFLQTHVCRKPARG